MVTFPKIVAYSSAETEDEDSEVPRGGESSVTNTLTCGADLFSNMRRGICFTPGNHVGSLES